MIFKKSYNYAMPFFFFMYSISNQLIHIELDPYSPNKACKIELVPCGP